MCKAFKNGHMFQKYILRHCLKFNDAYLDTV